MSDSHIVIANRLAEITRVARSVDEFAREHGLSDAMVADLQVALDEVLANIINYAYPDSSPREIGVQLRWLEDGVEIIVEDDGRAFDPLSVPEVDVSSPIAQRAPGGLGIHFTRTLMSEIAYARVGNLNRLSLRKRLRA